jgi:hypothetical protein
MFNKKIEIDMSVQRVIHTSLLEHMSRDISINDEDIPFSSNVSPKAYLYVSDNYHREQISECLDFGYCFSID